MMKEFFIKYWKWILLVALIAMGCYISAWYYFNIVKSKNEEEEVERT